MSQRSSRAESTRWGCAPNCRRGAHDPRCGQVPQGVVLQARLADDGPVSWSEMFDQPAPEFGEEMQPRACPQCGEIDCMEDTHDG